MWVMAPQFVFKCFWSGSVEFSFIPLYHFQRAIHDFFFVGPDDGFDVPAVFEDA